MNPDSQVTADQKLEQWEAGKRKILGIQALTRSTTVCELTGRLGFDATWLELEHGAANFETVEAMCIASQAANSISIARIPDHERHHVLRTLEVGARIVVVPMVNDAGRARDVVRWGKYAPLGERGFNTASRGLRYGLVEREENFAWANEHTHLIAQIETVEAVFNLDEILAIEGLSGVFIGPGDLSSSLGVPGQQEHPKLIETVLDIVGRAKAAGKHPCILAQRPLLKIAAEAGADLMICGSDTRTLTAAWTELLEDARGGFAD
jgi:2-keto-3-deoxy-L-rhamnonate aldolase RhmA